MMTDTSRDDFDRSFDYWSRDTCSRTSVSQDTTTSVGGGEPRVDTTNSSITNGGSSSALWFNLYDTSNNSVTAGAEMSVVDSEEGAQDHHFLGDAFFATQHQSSSVTSSAAAANNVSSLTPTAALSGARNSALHPNHHHSTNEDCVRIVLHEQLSAVYDDVSSEPSCQVEGALYAQYKNDLKGVPFCLILRDVLGQVVRIEPNDKVCQNVSDKVSRQGLHRLDKVLQVRMPSDSEQDQLRLATYSCAMRPVPLLVKSRVQVTQSHSRAGFKIRANPSNEFDLNDVVIMLAVPPYVKGSTVKMSRQGGVWNEMKRTISWNVDKLEPGEALEVQLQFDSMDGSWEREPKFPILVRGDCRPLFSAIELKSDFSDGLSRVVSTHVSTASRVLHRKV